MRKNILKDIESEIKRVENDESLKHITFSKEGEDLLFSRIAKYKEEKAEQEVLESENNRGKNYEFLSDEERELLELGREVKELDNKYVKKRGKRMVFALAAALVLTFAMGTIGITSRYKSLESVDKYAEEVQYKMLESEEDIIQPDDIVREQEAKQRIENFFGQPVMWLYGESIGVKYEIHNIFTDTKIVELLYSINDKTITYEIKANFNKLSVMELVEEGLESTEVIELNGIEYLIKKSKDGDIERAQVEFMKNELSYTLKLTLADEVEIEKILKNIK